MSANYPVVLRLNGKKVVVVGGGHVAERKVKGLLETDAEIVVISPAVTGELEGMSTVGRLAWLKKSFTKEDLENAFLIFAATDDEKLNQLVKASASANQLVMIADDPEASDFHVPAQLQRGRLNIAISTGGASPMLSGEIRKQLEKQFDEMYEEYLEFLFTARKRILKDVQDAGVKRKLFAALAGPEFFHSQNRQVDFEKILAELGF